MTKMHFQLFLGLVSSMDKFFQGTIYYFAINNERFHENFSTLMQQPKIVLW